MIILVLAWIINVKPRFSEMLLLSENTVSFYSVSTNKLQFFNIICNNTLSTFWYQPRVDKGQNLPWLNVAFVIFLGDIFY